MHDNYKTASPDRYSLLKEFAKHNRKEMTESETILWNALRKQIDCYKFRRQHIIGDYVADFVCLSEMLVIEVDGGYHNQPEQIDKDLIRTDNLQNMVFNVIRFDNNEMLDDVKDVIRRIKEELIK